MHSHLLWAVIRFGMRDTADTVQGDASLGASMVPDRCGDLAMASGGSYPSENIVDLLFRVLSIPVDISRGNCQALCQQDSSPS